MPERVGLLGWPVEHSVSAAMHNAAFAVLGLGWRYDLLPVPPGELEARVTALIAAGYRGFNVTVPHKQAVLRLPQIAEIDEAVEAAGAANTLIVRPDGSLRAANTDWSGFAADLRAHGVPVEGRHALVLGTGGSARAVAYALRRLGAASVTFASRSPSGREGVIGYEAVREMVEPPTPFRPSDTFPLEGGREESSPRPRWEGGRRAAEGEPLGGDGLIINCTPAGMWPDVARSPWPDGVPFPAGAILYDLIYNPPVTRLMRQAREAGSRAIGGLGMLVRQGAAAFELWTGIPAPLEVMHEAAQGKLASMA